MSSVIDIVQVLIYRFNTQLNKRLVNGDVVGEIRCPEPSYSRAFFRTHDRFLHPTIGNEIGAFPIIFSLARGFSNFLVLQGHSEEVKRLGPDGLQL